MFSFEMLFAIQGDPIFAERAEKLTYNALPATLTPDMWAHQYLQQPNEMNAIHSDDHVWAFDGPDSTLWATIEMFTFKATSCCSPLHIIMLWHNTVSLSFSDISKRQSVWQPCLVCHASGYKPMGSRKCNKFSEKQWGESYDIYNSQWCFFSPSYPFSQVLSHIHIVVSSKDHLSLNTVSLIFHVMIPAEIPCPIFLDT